MHKNRSDFAPDTLPFSILPAKGGADSWVPDADGDWDTVCNWSSGLPTSNTAVTINTTDTHSITHSTGNDFAKSLSVGNDQFALTGGTLTISGASSFADGLTIAGGVLPASKVSVKGPGIFAGGSVTGTTALTIGGAATLDNNFGLLGSATLSNTGTTSLTGNIFVGDGTGVNATIANAKGGVFQIVGAYNITANAQSAAQVNAGTLALTAGSSASVIGVDIQSTGSITAVQGATLEFEGTSNVISGTVGGAGQIAFGANADATLTDSTITLGTLGLDNSATLILGASTKLTGALIDESNGNNLLQLGADNLSLSGPTIFAGSFGSDYVTGSGTLSVAGTTTIATQVVFGGALTISNTAKGIYDLVNDSGLSTTTTSDFANAGLFEKTQGGGLSVISGHFTNTGTIIGTVTTDQQGDILLQNSGSAAHVVHCCVQDVCFTHATRCVRP